MRLRQTVIFGGVGQRPQIEALARGVDIVIATPGRLLDLMQPEAGAARPVEVLVLDEADRMLDMGFIRDVRKIVATLPMKRQTLLFSATMPGEIAKLSASMLNDPVRVEVTPAGDPVERIEQDVYHVEAGAKAALLSHVLDDPALSRVIVFTRTKHGANRVAEHLCQQRRRGRGDPRQQVADRAASGRCRGSATGNARVLVATDIAARGIDVDGITHVINYELPNEPESYVHRIGRTARAGRRGRGAVVLRRGRARLSARHRAADPAAAERGRRRPGARGARRRRPAGAGQAQVQR